VPSKSNITAFTASVFASITLLYLAWCRLRAIKFGRPLCPQNNQTKIPCFTGVFLWILNSYSWCSTSTYRGTP
jgi:hypothetical protein